MYTGNDEFLAGNSNHLQPAPFPNPFPTLTPILHNRALRFLPVVSIW